MIIHRAIMSVVSTKGLGSGLGVLRLQQRAISLSPVTQIKQIKRKEEGNRIVVEGEYNPSPREKQLIPQAASTPTGAPCPCPLCKLGLHIQHTDVLILRQFVDSKGDVIPKNVTGLCDLQHKRVYYLLVMAEKAGLIDRYTKDGKKRELVGWEQFNKYYDESAVEEFVHRKTGRYRA